MALFLLCLKVESENCIHINKLEPKTDAEILRQNTSNFALKNIKIRRLSWCSDLQMFVKWKYQAAQGAVCGIIGKKMPSHKKIPLVLAIAKVINEHKLLEISEVTYLFFIPQTTNFLTEPNREIEKCREMRREQSFLSAHLDSDKSPGHFCPII